MLPVGPSMAEADPAVEPPDVVLALLAPGDDLEPTLERLARRWPSSVVAGCETVTQFADEALCRGGVVQLFRFERPGHRVELSVLEGDRDRPPSEAAVARLAEEMAAADAVMVLADGLRFPVEWLLDQLRSRIAPMPVVVGGLASQVEPPTRPGARVIAGGQVLGSGCAVLRWSGVEAATEIVRGWSPASPVYRVTRAAGPVLYEIDHEPATEWYRRVFTVDGELAPLPETSFRFPLILEGPRPERIGVYRSMRRFDEPPGAVTFWGDLRAGDEVRLGMGNSTSLVRTAAQLAAGEAAEAAVLFSCVGREVVLEDQAEAEVRAIHRALGGLPLAGFFTFGEIGPTAADSLTLYNQTAVLVLLRERCG